MSGRRGNLLIYDNRVVSHKYLYNMSFRSEAYSPAMLGRNLNDR
jgi:hypothetical protein